MRENADNESKSGDKCEQIAVHGVIFNTKTALSVKTNNNADNLANENSEVKN